MSEQITYAASGTTAANTEIDLSGVITDPMDTRGSNDPIESAVLVDFTAGDGTDLTSLGQGAVGDPAAGEIVVVSDTSIALGDAVDTADQVVITYEDSGEGGIKS